jgi:AbrB family looped-hinge helix DNA binding protein
MPRTSTVVRLTGNYQVSVPKALRDKLGLKLGDFLDTSIERGAVVLRPKVLLDPGAIAADRARRGIGVSRAYDTAAEFVADLKTAARRLKTKRRSR